MYTIFISKNLQEFYKVDRTICSCKNELQFQTAQLMCENFGIMCDMRDAALKKLWLKNIFNIDNYRNWRQYRKTAKEQVDSVVAIMNNWAEQYRNWIDQQNEEKPRLCICGFANLSKQYEFGED